MNDSQPLVSVIIPAYNEEKNIAECLQSIKGQTCNFMFEIIVVNGPSSDNTGVIAKKLGVTVINIRKRGINQAWQTGVNTSMSDIVAFTEADCVVPVNWLENVYKVFKGSTNVVGLVGQYRLKKFTVFNKIISVFMPFFDSVFKLWTGFTTLRGTNFAVRKSALLKCGGFNTKMKTYGDIELSLRLGKIGKVVYKKDLIVLTENRNFISIRSQIKMYIRSLKALYYVTVVKMPYKLTNLHER